MPDIVRTAFRVPTELARPRTEHPRVLVIGSCLSSALPECINRMWGPGSADWIPLNNFSKLPVDPPRPVDQYDFQVIQLATRSVLREREYIQLPVTDEAPWKALFDSTVERLRIALDSFLQYNKDTGLLTFVSNFFVPQQNPMGRLLRRNDYRNLAYFFRQLNDALSDIVAEYANVHILDSDEIAASLGRRHIQDDVIWTIAHGAAMSNADAELDRSRIEPAGRLSDIYHIRVYAFLEEVVHELAALFATVRGTDSVKLVVTDLDDTLWRGLIGEGERPPDDGWPEGYAEALALLVKRGILVAAISKNDEAIVRSKWRSILSLESLVALRVNWKDKVTNMQELLHEVNLLPGNVVYVDDNPVERQNMALSFPDIRVVGRNPYELRRILLWSPETQLPKLSDEAMRRTKMVSKQIEREHLKRSVSREEFLSSLKVHLRAYHVDSTNDPRFARSFELLNKTNQFNTTGRRWTHSEAAASLSDGVSWFCFSCEDTFTDYGIISVALVSHGRLEQMVLSCRVFGFDVERAILGALSEAAGVGPELQIQFVSTGKNHVAFQMLKDLGFSEREGLLSIDRGRVEHMPSHITVTKVQPAVNP